MKVAGLGNMRSWFVTGVFGRSPLLPYAVSRGICLPAFCQIFFHFGSNITLGAGVVKEPPYNYVSVSLRLPNWQYEGSFGELSVMTVNIW